MKFNLKKPGAKAPKAAPGEAAKAAGRRALKNGAYATVLAVIVLVAVILINVVAGALPTRYTQFDISLSGMFTLTDTTKNALQALDKDVTAYYLAETGSEDSNITRVLDRYADASSHFNWQQRDPALYPNFASQYDAADATNGSVILVCGDNHTLVDYYDMYEADYSNYYTTGSYTYSFSAENALTSGLARVTSGTAYTIYEVTGHGETALETDYTDTLSNANVAVESLNLLTAGEVPEEAAAVVINTPQVDYTAETVELLRAYLENGGSLLVATSLEYDTPNLDALLAEYGMTRQEGIAIEGDANYCYSGRASYLVPDVASNTITSGMTSGMYAFMPYAQGIVTDASNEDLTLTPLLTTSTASYTIQATAETAEKTDDSASGPLNVAVASESAGSGAKVVWLNCGNALTAAANQYVSGGNAQLFGSIINWMNGEENAVVIDSKSMSAETLSVPAFTTMCLGLLFTIVLPIALLVAGIVTFILRRRK